MATATAGKLLESTDVEKIRADVRRRASASVAAIDDALPGALAGSGAATRAYVDAYLALTQTLTKELAGDADALQFLLENYAGQAAFSPWAATYDAGDAVSLDLLSRLRELLGAEPLPAPRHPAPTPRAIDVAIFLRRVRWYLNSRLEAAPLPRIMDAFGLSKSELGRLFGVSRQAIDGWMAFGVPVDRSEKLTTLLSLADVLGRKVKAGRLPGIARTPADAYGGLTMLQMVEADRHRELLRLVRDSFAWSEAA